MFELHQLRVFAAVVRAGTFSGGAREVGLSQPAVTQQVRKLETAVGGQVFLRSGRTLSLTPLGGLVWRWTDRILGEVALAEREIADAATGDPRVVRVATFGTASSTLASSAIVELHRNNPELWVDLTVERPDRARASLRRGDVDLAITCRYGAGSAPSGDALASDRIEVEHLLDERTFVALAETSEYARRETLAMSDLVNETWLLAVSVPDLHAEITALFHELDRTPKILRAPDDNVAFQAFVAQGLGITLVPALAIEAHLETGLALRTIPGLPVRHVEVEFHPAGLRDRQVTAMLQALRAVAVKLAPRLGPPTS